MRTDADLPARPLHADMMSLTMLCVVGDFRMLKLTKYVMCVMPAARVAFRFILTLERIMAARCAYHAACAPLQHFLAAADGWLSREVAVAPVAQCWLAMNGKAQACLSLTAAAEAAGHRAWTRQSLICHLAPNEPRH